MSTQRRPRTFTTAGGGTRVTADEVPDASASVVPIASGTSDNPSKEAWNNGHPELSQPADDDYSLTALMSAGPDPDMDLVTKSYALPRYLAEAVRLYNVKTRRPQQAIIADALRAHLPPALVEACRRNAQRR